MSARWGGVGCGGPADDLGRVVGTAQMLTRHGYTMVELS